IHHTQLAAPRVRITIPDPAVWSPQRRAPSRALGPASRFRRMTTNGGNGQPPLKSLQRTRRGLLRPLPFSMFLNFLYKAQRPIAHAHTPITPMVPRTIANETSLLVRAVVSMFGLPSTRGFLPTWWKFSFISY